MHSFFENKTILVTGGTGTIGSEIVSQLLTYNPASIRILSNSENELWETRNRFISYVWKLRFLLGDIRNYHRVMRAMKGVDFVFNAAALKHVPVCEYNPIEAVRVNVLGLENILESAINNNVKKIVHISTDKAISPTSVMGATKMLCERVCISKSLTLGKSPLIISCVRFGNVLGSRGSIIPLIKHQIEKGNEVTLTGDEMQRFFMSIAQAVNLVLKAMVLAEGNEIFVLKMQTIRIRDLIEVIIEEYAPSIGKEPNSITIRDVGPRLGEKFNEDLISPIEVPFCYEVENMYIIYPSIDFGGNQVDLTTLAKGKKVSQTGDFSYNTGNQELMGKEGIRKLLRELELL